MVCSQKTKNRYCLIPFLISLRAVFKFSRCLRIELNEYFRYLNDVMHRWLNQRRFNFYTEKTSDGSSAKIESRAGRSD